MDIKIPTVGESITEATISEWFKSDGDYVEQNEVLLSLETDKASVEVVAEKAGKLKIITQADETVEIGAIVGSLDTSAKSDENSNDKSNDLSGDQSTDQSDGKISDQSDNNSNDKSESEESSSNTSESKNTSKDSDEQSDTSSAEDNRSENKSTSDGKQSSSSMASTLSPATRRVIEERRLDANQIKGTGPGGRITKEDAQNFQSSSENKSGSKAIADKVESKPASAKERVLAKPSEAFASRESRREKMTTIRKRIAERLVQAQQDAAILTTFNEVDMSAVMNLRTQYKELFEKKHGIRLGFMGFFAKAVVSALKDFPAVNAYIDGDELIFNDFVNMGIAVGGPKGLVVPVIKDVDLLSISDIESEVKRYAEKAQANKLSIDDLTGGTFTISNGGVYGSLMSTPILNPPQSGILGMHKIEQRPVAIDGKVEIRPMMYLALSYDHRVVDGKQSVSFLVKIKEALEDPSRMILEV